MKYCVIFSILLCLIHLHGVTGDNRILSELSDSSTKWQFKQFSTQVEQNMETIVLPNGQLLFVQSQIDVEGVKKITLQKYLRDSTKVGDALIVGDSNFQCTRPKVALITDVGFALGWIGTQIEQSSFFLQIFNFDLIAITDKQLIDNVHLEVHWDMVSEFHYLKQIFGTKIQIFYKPPTATKTWNALIFDYQDNSRTDVVSLPFSKTLDIAINKIYTIVVLQYKENSYEVRFTVMNIKGQISRTDFSTQQYGNLQTQRKLIALSNNNFVYFTNYGWSTLSIYDSHFSTIIQTNQNHYYYPNYQQGVYTYWEYQNYFVGGSIKLQSLQDSFVIVGVNISTFKFRLLHLSNQLEFIQFREVLYDNINIYKYSIQKTDDTTIFVQWIDGLPETLIPEYKQNIYQSELDLQLSLSECSANCEQCLSKQTCMQCSNNYNLVNSQCQLQCIDNCKSCSNISSCDQCNEGFFFDNKLQCVQQINSIQEVRISNSETTNKRGSKFKMLDNRNIVLVYREQDQTDEIIQIKLLDQQGNTLQQRQLSISRLLNFDLIIQDQVVFIYILQYSSDNYSKITIYQYQIDDLKILNMISLPQLQNYYYFNFQYLYTSANFFEVIQFQNTFTIVYSGFADYYWQRIVSQTYDYNGNLINNYYFGDYYVGDLFFYNSKQFDVAQYDGLMYIVVTRYCDLELIVMNEFGQIIRSEYPQNYYWCQYNTNPSITKSPSSETILISYQNAANQIFVFSWYYHGQIFKYQSQDGLSSPQIIALDSNSFILLFLINDFQSNYRTLNYLHFSQGQVIKEQIINQFTIQPTDVFYSTYENNKYILIAWTGLKNVMEISTNQVYLQQISINNDSIIGLIKICPSNCSDCDNNGACLTCETGYQVTSISKCSLICADNCYYCEQYATCQVCNYGYQKQDDQCIQSQTNQFAKLQEVKNRIEYNQQIAISSKGIVIVSWISYDVSQNRYRPFIKTFDQHGNQLNEFIIDNCSKPLQIKVFTMNELNLIGYLCGEDSYIRIGILDQNVNYIQTWYYSQTINLVNSIPSNNHFDITSNDFNQIFIVAQTMQDSQNYKLFVGRFVYDPYRNYFVSQWLDWRENFNQQIQYLSIQEQSGFIYYSYTYPQHNPDTGVNPLSTISIKADYNFYQINREIVAFERMQLILSNSNWLKVTNQQNNLLLQINRGNSQIFSTTIQSDMTIEDFDLTKFQHGFLVIWTQSASTDATNLERTLNSQVFFNNGTQITEIKQLASFSNFPSDPQVQSLQNGEFIVVWSDVDSTGKSLFAARYNQLLAQIPLTSVICKELCEVCLTSTSCQRCSDGYYVSGDICSPQCQQNCYSCTIPYTCDICYSQSYFQDNNCYYDQFRVEEERVARIQNIQNTRVSIATFSDTSFVVAWNDNPSGVQSIFFQFYDNQRKPVDSIKTLQGDSDRQFVQIKSLADDKLAVVWFDGDCTVQCKLVLQIFDQQLSEYISETIIALVALPIINNQQPVQIDRQDNKLIIAYLSYENQKTTSYYAIYQIDSLSLLSPIQIENSDVQVDNLDIVIFNSDSFYIIYVANNVQLKAINNKNGDSTYFVIYDNTNQIETPTHIINDQSGLIILVWSEKQLIDNQYINKLNTISFDSVVNSIQASNKIESYHNEYLELPRLIKQNGQDQINIFYRSFDFSTKLNKKLAQVNVVNNALNGQKQISSYSYEHKFFQVAQLEQEVDSILVDVGFDSFKQPTIFIIRLDNQGNPIKMGDVVCPQNCSQCQNNHSCQQCADGYNLLGGYYCEKQCQPNYVSCEVGKMICANGYTLSSQFECLSIDPSKAQKLINTNQYDNQKQQNIATLSNYYSVVVWQSKQQNINGMSIYMQKFDSKFTKVGSETLITKDGIGIQYAPNVAALQNNEFVVIWKDSNPLNVLRILMQKFSFDFEKIGDEIIVDDSGYHNLLHDITYDETNYQLVTLYNGNLAILLRQSTYYYGSYVNDLRLLLFDSNLSLYSSQLIGQSVCCEQFDSLTAATNNIFVAWKNLGDELKIVAVDINGNMVNGETIFSGYHSSLSITNTDQGQLAVGWVSSNQVTVQLFDLTLQKVGDAQVISLSTENYDQISTQVNGYISQIQLKSIQGGIIATILARVETPCIQTSILALQIFDNYLTKTNYVSQINDYRGNIDNIQASNIGNGEFVVTWEEWLYVSDSWSTRSERDSNGFGLYVKRFNSEGSVLPIESMVCQTNCNECSKDNLCESCLTGYHFDSTQSICILTCPNNCMNCYIDYNFGVVCGQCNDGYAMNINRNCDKIQDDNGNEFYLVGDQYQWANIFDQKTLQNGNIVVFYNKYGCDQFYFKIIDNQGNVIVNEQYVSSGNGCNLVRTTALTSGHFAIINRSFYTQYYNNIWLHVYDENGVLIREQSIIDYAIWNYYYWWNWNPYNSNLLAIKSLSNGGFLIIYMNDNDGRYYTQPKIYLRVYNSLFYQISNDIQLQTDEIYSYYGYYYWDWWNGNSNQISIVETENNLLLLFNYNMYYWWYSNYNKIQITQIQKSDFTQMKKILDISYSQWSWWYYNYQNIQMWQTEQNKFLIFRTFPDGLVGTYFDSEFQFIEERSIRNIDSNQQQSYAWINGCGWCCVACCYNCWDQNSFQIIKLDDSFMLSYYSHQCNYYSCYQIAQLLPFTFNLEKLSQPKQIEYVIGNSIVQSQREVIRQYLNNNILLMQAFYTNQYAQMGVTFDKFDFIGTKLEKWSLHCSQNCRNCVNQNNQIKCLDCKTNYYLDDTYNCNLKCEYDHCITCQNSGSNNQFCIQCESGYQLKDNYYCIEQNTEQILETKLEQSQQLINSAPKINTFLDGTMAILTLQKIDQNYILYGQLLTKEGDNIGDIVELLRNPRIIYFDFSISSTDQIFLVWSDLDNQVKIQGQKYGRNFGQISSQIEIYQNQAYQFNSHFATVQYLQDDSIVILLFGGDRLYMTKLDLNLSISEITYVDQAWYGGWWWQYSDWQFYYYYYQNELFFNAPQIIANENYYVISYFNFWDSSQLQLRTYDYNQQLLYASQVQYSNAAQASMVFLENGNIAITWRALYVSNYWFGVNVQNYQQTSIVYAITNPQYTFTSFNYFGIDYVNEEKPDIQSIPNGFAIAFSGTSEKNSQHIDLRIVYFDLFGTQQTGIISVSSICKSPNNPQISSLRDGSVVVSWFQDDWIYMQKVDRNGVLQKLDTIICSNHCSRCQVENTCDSCLNGFQLNEKGQCEEICLIENCRSCLYWSSQCRVCNSGYFVDEQLQVCNAIDESQNFEKQISVSNVYSQSVITINNVAGDLINIWINYDAIANNYQILGQSFTSDGSQLKESSVITYVTEVYYQIQGVYNEQFNTIIVLLINQESVQVLQISDQFQVVGQQISLVDLLKSEFPLGYGPQSLEIKYYIDGFALIAKGNKKKVIDPYSSSPHVVVCNEPEILLINLNGKLAVPSINFWSNERLSNGFLDQNNQCYQWDLKEAVFEEQIYVILSNTDYREQLYFQIYDYNGQKIRERNLQQFVGTAYWWKLISMSRQSNGDFYIVGLDSKLIQINSKLEFISIHNLDIAYDNEIQIVNLNSQYLTVVTKQSYYSINRFKLWIYDLNSNSIIHQGFISQTAVNQNAFNYFYDTNGNLLFSWQEIEEESVNLGNQYFVRINSQGQQIKYEQFVCLPNCNECTVATKCNVCSDGYHLDTNQICTPTCSDNCKSCQIPLTCDLCNLGYYSNDNQQCQSKEGQPTEKLINSQSQSSQIHVRVAQFSDGSGVVVWQSDSQDGSGFGVYTQKIDSTGNEIGDEIRININTKGSQYFPDVTTLSNGNVIIIWVDGDIETQAQLYYQQFDNDMKRIGSPIFVDYIKVPWISYLDVPCVVQSLIGKQFALIWINFDDNGQQTTFVTVVDENGVRINTTPIYNNDSNKEIVVSSNGMNFVVIYRQTGFIQGSIFDLNGLFQNTVIITQTPASSPGIAANYIGQYIIAWQSNGFINYQIFDSQLSGLGQQFQVDIIEGVFSDNPDVVSQSNGFVIVWQNSDLQGKRSRKIRIQIFDVNGVSLGNSIEVDVDTVYGEYPQLSLLNNDEFVVVWNAQNVDSVVDEGSGIYMIKFSSSGIKQSLGGIICPNRCQNCSNQDTCIKCVEDYVLEPSGSCIPQCADNCGSCSSPLSCDICSDGYKLDPSGFCSKITADLTPEDSLLATPLLSLPSFSSSVQISNGVIVYAGTVVQVGVSYYLEINLQLMAGDDSNQLIHQIPIASTSTSIIHSDIIIKEDNSIQIYWVEVISQVIRIKVITISYLFEVIEEEALIDTIWVTQVHDESRLYVYYQNTQYYVIHSVYTTQNNYEVYQHQVSNTYIRITEPIIIVVLTRQITYSQILFSIDSVVFLEYTETFKFRTYRFTIDFVSMDMKEASFDFGFSNYANSFMLRRLKYGGYVVCWRSSTQLSLTSRSYIYYSMFNDNIEWVSSYYVVTQSNGVLGNPQIIVQDDRFAVIWNNQISVSYSQLSISYYTNFGSYISTTTQLNTISNNIQYYYATVTIKYEIIINWISQITYEYEPRYQIFVTAINHDGYLIPSPSLICLSKCSTCNNQFTCLTCAKDYYQDKKTFDCIPLCPNACQQCQDPTACQICQDGYTLNEQTKLCEQNPCKTGCKTCNLLQQCLRCEINYLLNLNDTTQCIPTCPEKCAQCTTAPICDYCEQQNYWSDVHQKCVEFEIVIEESFYDNPLIATFPTGDYVKMWIQHGQMEGIFFQLYKKNGTKIGGPTKVNMDNTNNRRLLSDVNIIEKTLFSDLAAFQDEFVVVWVDQTVGDMKVKFKKFNIQGNPTSEEITIKELPKQRLEEMVAPCQITKAYSNNFIVGFLQRIDDNVSNAATMFIQSFNKNLEPIGKLQTLANTDFTKAAMISASEDGKISITFSSNGYVYLTQISMEGNYLNEPMKVADGKAFKSTNLKNNKIVFVFEAVSTNISPPQFILQFEIMDANKTLSEPVIISSPQLGEEHPFVTTIASDFIVAWRTVDQNLKSQDILFQIFDEFGNRLSQQIKVDKQGLDPKNPSVQILNEDDFYITWTGKSNNSTDAFYVQAFKRSVVTNVEVVQQIMNQTLCNPNCISCENQTKCNICSNGYYEQNGYCEIDCGLNCSICSRPFECDICQEGYYFNQYNQCEIIDCEQDYILNENYECVPVCQDNCLICQSFNVCLTCQESFYLSEGQCIDQILVATELPQEQSLTILILSYILGTIVLVSSLILITCYFKKKKQNQVQLTQPNQVVDEIQETHIADSSSARVN